MGFLDFLTGKVDCPNCGTKGARKSGDTVRCPNHYCSNFDPTLQVQGPAPQTEARAPQDKPAVKGNFAAARPVTIRYLNYQEQQKSFIADSSTAERTKNHLVVQVAPTGNRINLSRDRIQNLSEVEAACRERVRLGTGGPTSTERRVLTFHATRKTTSPLYEKLRAKYRNW